MAEEHQEPHEPQEQRIYTREFKLEAVRLSESSEKTVAQIARDLGVPERVLYRWRHELREQADHRECVFPGKGHQSELEEENRRLRRELELLKQEREILKKAVGIFSHGQP
jgi:transposase